MEMYNAIPFADSAAETLSFRVCIPASMTLYRNTWRQAIFCCAAVAESDGLTHSAEYWKDMLAKFDNSFRLLLDCPDCTTSQVDSLATKIVDRLANFPACSDRAVLIGRVRQALFDIARS